MFLSDQSIRSLIVFKTRPHRRDICFQRPRVLCTLVVLFKLRFHPPWSVPNAIRAPGRTTRLQLGGTCPSTTPSLSPSTRSVSLLLAHNDSLVLFSSFVTACSIPERWRRGPQVLTSRRVPHLRTVIATMRNQITRTTRAEIRVTGAATQISPPTEVSTTSEHSLAAPREIPMTVRVQLDQHYLFKVMTRPQLPFRHHQTARLSVNALSHLQTATFVFDMTKVWLFISDLF